MNATTLYLTATETAKFRKLSESLQEGWTVEPETGTAYESAEVLKIRSQMARFQSFPQMKKIAQDAAEGKIDEAALKDLPESVMPELCFTIGARGITVLIAALFANIAEDRDIVGLAGLTHIRHQILETNTSVSYVR